MEQYNPQNPNPQGAPYQQPNYQQPPYQQPYQPAPPAPAFDPTTQVMSIGSYIGMFILSSIPLVNVICWIVWLCSPSTNKNKKNFIWATIILSLITSVVATVCYLAFGTALLGALSSAGTYM